MGFRVPFPQPDFKQKIPRLSKSAQLLTIVLYWPQYCWNRTRLIGANFKHVLHPNPNNTSSHCWLYPCLLDFIIRFYVALRPSLLLLLLSAFHARQMPCVQLSVSCKSVPIGDGRRAVHVVMHARPIQSQLAKLCFQPPPGDGGCDIGSRQSRRGATWKRPPLGR